MRFSRTTSILVLVVLLSIFADRSFGDIVHLRDGSTVEGVVIDQNAREVIVEIKIGSITTKKRISIREVDRIEYKPIEETQPDRTIEPEDEPEPEVDPDPVPEPVPMERKRERVRDPRNKDSYVVIPISGRMGIESNSFGLKDALERSARKKATHIVFLLDANGGYVYDALETLDLFEQYDKTFEFHTIVTGDVGGAACAYLAGADRIWIRPGVSIGGPVDYPRDIKERAKRFDMEHHDQWADRMAEIALLNNRSGSFFRAFVDKSTALWVVDGTIVDSRPSSGVSRSLDTSSSVLSITAESLIDLKLADAFEGDPDDLGKVIGSEQWVEVRRIAESTMAKSAEERVSIQKEWDETSEIIDGLIASFERNDPRAYTDYGYELVEYRKRGGSTTSRNRDSRLRGFILMPDGRSIELWKQRCANALQNCDHILEGLRKSADLAERAKASGMRHFIIDRKYADEVWEKYSSARSSLGNSAGAIPQEILEDLWVKENPVQP